MIRSMTGYGRGKYEIDSREAIEKKIKGERIIAPFIVSTSDGKYVSRA